MDAFTIPPIHDQGQVLRKDDNCKDQSWEPKGTPPMPPPPPPPRNKALLRDHGG